MTIWGSIVHITLNKILMKVFIEGKMRKKNTIHEHVPNTYLISADSTIYFFVGSLQLHYCGRASSND